MFVFRISLHHLILFMRRQKIDRSVDSDAAVNFYRNLLPPPSQTNRDLISSTDLVSQEVERRR